MLQSRRGFLIGAGAVLTTAFVKDARSFIHRNNQPLLTPPSQAVETMYWHEIPDEGYQLTLGPWSVAPPPPTWRKFFVSEGIPHRTDREIEKICCAHCTVKAAPACRRGDRIGPFSCSAFCQLIAHSRPMYDASMSAFRGKADSGWAAFGLPLLTHCGSIRWRIPPPNWLAS
jgi:hypothetical protein